MCLMPRRWKRGTGVKLDLSSRSERTIWSVCRSKEVGEVDARARGRGDIESSSTDTHTNCVRRDGAGAWEVLEVD